MTSYVNSLGRSVTARIPRQRGDSDGGTVLTFWMQIGPGRSGLPVAIDAMPRQGTKDRIRAIAEVRDRD
jgi:hypothetical protein